MGDTRNFTERGSLFAPQVWKFVVPPPVPMRRLFVANTGMPIPGMSRTARLLGTVTHRAGIVWHVWDGDAE